MLDIYGEFMGSTGIEWDFSEEQIWDLTDKKSGFSWDLSLIFDEVNICLFCFFF